MSKKNFSLFDLKKGQLLVSTPVIKDPNFDRTVVYLLEHSHEGSLGIILNRPAPEELKRDLESVVMDVVPYGEIDAVKCMIGGPVAVEDHYIVLAKGPFSLNGEGIIEISEGVYGLGLDANLSPDIVSQFELRIYCGYAGWDAGQLQSELVIGGWIVLEPEGVQDIFWDGQEDLWRRLLKRKGGKLAALANYPDDLAVN
jgi:putative transcriptional regulator